MPMFLCTYWWYISLLVFHTFISSYTTGTTVFAGTSWHYQKTNDHHRKIGSFSSYHSCCDAGIRKHSLPLHASEENEVNCKPEKQKLHVGGVGPGLCREKVQGSISHISIWEGQVDLLSGQLPITVDKETLIDWSGTEEGHWFFFSLQKVEI